MPDELQTLDGEVPVEGTDHSIAIARADQGVRIIELAFANPGLGIHVYEGERGDDIESFRRRLGDWMQDDNEPFLEYMDPRFGRTCYMSRGAIPLIVAFSLQYREARDTRAGIARRAVDGNGLPIVRRR